MIDRCVVLFCEMTEILQTGGGGDSGEDGEGIVSKHLMEDYDAVDDEEERTMARRRSRRRSAFRRPLMLTPLSRSGASGAVTSCYCFCCCSCLLLIHVFV